MSDSLWSDYRDDAMASLQESDEIARRADEDSPDSRCWACARRSGTVPGGRVPLCLRHYVKLRLRYPSVLLDEDPQHRRGPAEPEHGSRATIGSIDEEERS